MTWLQDANYVKTSGYNDDGRLTWPNALDWVSQLSYQGFDDWRLPTISPVNGTSFQYGLSYDGSTDQGYNNSSQRSELGYMFHVNLGNLSHFDTNGNIRSGSTGTDFGVTNAGLFINLENYLYWTSERYDRFLFDPVTWTFFANTGFQGPANMLDQFHVWAVRSGDVITTVPVPGAVWMFASGVLGFIGLRCKR